MKVYRRICIKDAVVEAQNGDRHEIKRGKEYTTSYEHEDGTVTVFGPFWTRFPVEILVAPEPL